MKKGVICVFCLLAFTGIRPAFSTSNISSQTHLPGEAWLDMKAKEFVMLSTKDFSRICGKKLNLKEKISFSVMKKKIKHELKKNPNLTVREYLASDNQKMNTGTLIAIILIAALFILIIAGQFMLGGS